MSTTEIDFFEEVVKVGDAEEVVVGSAEEDRVVVVVVGVGVGVALEEKKEEEEEEVTAGEETTVEDGAVEVLGKGREDEVCTEVVDWAVVLTGGEEVVEGTWEEVVSGEEVVEGTEEVEGGAEEVEGGAEEVKGGVEEVEGGVEEVERGAEEVDGRELELEVVKGMELVVGASLEEEEDDDSC